METWIDQHEQRVCGADEAESRIADLESKLSDIADELAGATGLTPGDQAKIDSAAKIAAMEG